MKSLLIRTAAVAALSASLTAIGAGAASARPIDGLDCNMVMDAWVYSSESLNAAKATGNQTDIRYWQQEYNANERWVRVNC